MDEYPDFIQQYFTFDIEIIPDCASYAIEEVDTIVFDPIVLGHHVSTTVDFTDYYTCPLCPLSGKYSNHCGPLEYVLDSGSTETYLDYNEDFLLTLTPLNDGTHSAGTYSHTLRA